VSAMLSPPKQSPSCLIPQHAFFSALFFYPKAKKRSKKIGQKNFDFAVLIMEGEITAGKNIFGERRRFLSIT
jgi:hypothetical protein